MIRLHGILQEYCFSLYQHRLAGFHLKCSRRKLFISILFGEKDLNNTGMNFHRENCKNIRKRITAVLDPCSIFIEHCDIPILNLFQEQ